MPAACASCPGLPAAGLSRFGVGRVSRVPSEQTSEDRGREPALAVFVARCRRCQTIRETPPGRRSARFIFGASRPVARVMHRRFLFERCSATRASAGSAPSLARPGRAPGPGGTRGVAALRSVDPARGRGLRLPQPATHLPSSAVARHVSPTIFCRAIGRLGKSCPPTWRQKGGRSEDAPRTAAPGYCPARAIRPAPPARAVASLGRRPRV
jgi:hypothetical protein